MATTALAAARKFRGVARRFAESVNRRARRAACRATASTASPAHTLHTASVASASIVAAVASEHSRVVPRCANAGRHISAARCRPHRRRPCLFVAGTCDEELRTGPARRRGRQSSGGFGEFDALLRRHRRAFDGGGGGGSGSGGQRWDAVTLLANRSSRLKTVQLAGDTLRERTTPPVPPALQSPRACRRSARDANDCRHNERLRARRPSAAARFRS